MLRLYWQHLTRRRSDDLAFGCDAARVQLTERPGSAVVVCVDTRADSARARVLVTLLLVDEQKAMQQEVKQDFWQLKSPAECSFKDLFDLLPRHWSLAQFHMLQQCLPWL